MSLGDHSQSLWHVGWCLGFGRGKWGTQQPRSLLQDQSWGGQCFSGGGLWCEGGPPRWTQQPFSSNLHHREIFSLRIRTLKEQRLPEFIFLAAGWTSMAGTGRDKWEGCRDNQECRHKTRDESHIECRSREGCLVMVKLRERGRREPDGTRGLSCCFISKNSSIDAQDPSTSCFDIGARWAIMAVAGQAVSQITRRACTPAFWNCCQSGVPPLMVLVETLKVSGVISDNTLVCPIDGDLTSRVHRWWDAFRTFAPGSPTSGANIHLQYWATTFIV